MKLDHAAFMTKSSCQGYRLRPMPRHPSDDWTQKQYYAFASSSENGNRPRQRPEQQKDRKRLFAEKEKLFHRPPFSSAEKKYGNNEMAQRKIKSFAKISKNLRLAILWRFSTTKSNLPCPTIINTMTPSLEIPSSPLYSGQTFGGPKTPPFGNSWLIGWLPAKRLVFSQSPIGHGPDIGKRRAEPLHNVEIRKASNPILLKTLSRSWSLLTLIFELFMGGSSHQSLQPPGFPHPSRGRKAFSFSGTDTKKTVGRTNLGFPRHPHGQGPTPLQTTRTAQLARRTRRAVRFGIHRSKGRREIPAA